MTGNQKNVDQAMKIRKMLLDILWKFQDIKLLTSSDLTHADNYMPGMMKLFNGISGLQVEKTVQICTKVTLRGLT